MDPPHYSLDNVDSLAWNNYCREIFKAVIQWVESLVIADNQNPDCVFFTSGSAVIKVGSIHNGAVSEFMDLSRALPGRCLRHIAQDAKGDFYIITSDSVIYTIVYAGWSVTRLTLLAEARVWHPNYLQTIGDWGLLLADWNTNIMRLLNDTDRTITRFRVQTCAECRPLNFPFSVLLSNNGILFVGEAGKLLQLIRKHLPQLRPNFQPLSNSWESNYPIIKIKTY